MAKPASNKSSKKPPKFDPAKPALQELTFAEKYRCFAKGKTIKFRSGVNLLVGEQGSGKSSLLGLLLQLADRSEMRRDEARETVKVVTQQVPLASFDFEKSNPRTQSHFGDNIGFQVSSMFSSHGETVKAMLASFRKGYTDEDAPPTLILLDEPDMALSPRSARLLAETLQDIGDAGHQVLAAVHNPLVIASQEQVLSLEHGRWLKSSTFLNKHATEDSPPEDGFGEGGPKQQAVRSGR